MWQNPARGKATAEGQADRQLKYNTHASKLRVAVMTLSGGCGVFSAADWGGGVFLCFVMVCKFVPW